MPALDDTGEALLRAEQDAQKTVKSLWEGFQDFALRDNVLEVATGLMFVFPVRNGS
jgi:large conductance mechanosensitive channel